MTLDKICPAWVPSNLNYFANCEHNNFLETNFNFRELNLAINSCNKKSSPGLYGIDYNIIDKLPIKYKLILVDIYNEMYRASNYPDEWKNVYVHFILNSMQTV